MVKDEHAKVKQESEAQLERTEASHTQELEALKQQLAEAQQDLKLIKAAHTREIKAMGKYHATAQQVSKQELV